MRGTPDSRGEGQPWKSLDRNFHKQWPVQGGGVRAWSAAGGRTGVGAGAGVRGPPELRAGWQSACQSRLSAGSRMPSADSVTKTVLWRVSR